MLNVEENLTNISLLLRNLVDSGISLLNEDMERYPDFDSLQPREEKDKYIAHANEIGTTIFMASRGFSRFLGFPEEVCFEIVELYYKVLLDQILSYEKTHARRFNKGIVYARLGLAQVGSGKFNQGIPHLLRAYEEDRVFYKDYDTAPFMNEAIFKQIEKPMIEYLVNIGNRYSSEENVTVDESYVEGFLNRLDIDDRLFLLAIINGIYGNIQILNGNDNAFTRGRIFANVQDLCLFLESVWKKKTGYTGTLGTLINQSFSSESWLTLVRNSTYISSNNITELESNLQGIFTQSNSVARRFLILRAIRNFSAHNFDTRSNYFFNNLERILEEIVGVIFFLNNRGML